jgi:hypothetical protein
MAVALFENTPSLIETLLVPSETTPLCRSPRRSRDPDDRRRVQDADPADAQVPLAGAVDLEVAI